jgi:type VI secretion system protein
MSRRAFSPSRSLALMLGCACSAAPPAPKLPVLPGVPQAALPAVPSRVAGLHLKSAVDMNDRMALMLDVVFLYDAGLVSRMPASGPAWFAQREKLMLENAGFLDVLSFELTVADDTGELRLTELQRRAAAVVVYANYLSNLGQPRVNISVFRCPALLAMSDGLVVNEEPSNVVYEPAGRFQPRRVDVVRCGR